MVTPVAEPPASMVRPPPLPATKPETVVPDWTSRSTTAPLSSVTPSIVFEVAPPLKVSEPLDRTRLATPPPLTVAPSMTPPDWTISSPPLLTTVPLAVPLVSTWR